MNAYDEAPATDTHLQRRLIDGEPVMSLGGMAAVSQALRLRSEGLTYGAVATVMRVYHGSSRTENAWRRMLRTHGATPAAHYVGGNLRKAPKRRGEM